MTNRARETQGPGDVFDAVRTLLAVRSYQSTPVPDALVTPSGHAAEAQHLLVP